MPNKDVCFEVADSVVRQSQIKWQGTLKNAFGAIMFYMKTILQCGMRERRRSERLIVCTL